MNLQNKFCSKPFEYLEFSVSHEDTITACVCCYSWLPETIGDLNKQTVADIWNSEKIKEIRQSIHDGSFRFCKISNCGYIQGNLLPNREDVSDPYLKQIIDDNLTDVSRGPRILNMANDRSCNLYCPQCRNEHIMVSDGPTFDKMKFAHERLLKETLPDLESIIFCSSGDPFASKLYRNILLELDGKNFPKLKIFIVTNGLLFTPRMWRKLKKIHSNVEAVLVSVDATTSEVYQKIRRGGDYHVLLKNLRFLSKLRSKIKINDLRMDFVVQTANYRQMPDFIKLAEKHNAIPYFQKILPAASMTDDEFKQCAVYLSTHPMHNDFMETMQHPAFANPIVRLGNLREYINRD